MAKKARPAKRYKSKTGRRRKRVKSRRVYNPQTGRITGRAAGGLERLQALTKKYQDEGLPLEEAHRRAITELRENPRKDWRGG
jgi:hypothetical protein